MSRSLTPCVCVMCGKMYIYVTCHTCDALLRWELSHVYSFCEATTENTKKNRVFQLRSMLNVLPFCYRKRENRRRCLYCMFFQCTTFVRCIVSSLKNGEIGIFMRSSGCAQPHKYFGDTIFLMVNKKQRQSTNK